MKFSLNRHQARKDSGFGVLAKWQTDIWAALLFLDQTKISAAKHRLERTPLNGIRHFSALGCAVSLEDAKEVQREVTRLDRASDPNIGSGFAPSSGPKSMCSNEAILMNQTKL